MRKKIKRILCLFAVAALALPLVFLCSCGLTSCVGEPPGPAYKSFGDADFISASGTELRTAKGTGEKIELRGINAGGLLVIEPWMCAVKATGETGALDHKKMTEIFTERFGAEKTIELWEHYRKSFWTRQDFVNCADMGINVIRLPFTYMNVDPMYNNVRAVAGQKYNFSVLDEFVSTAEQYGIYTILDMHGAYGSQNGQHHSGEIFSPSDVDFFTNEEKQNKTIELWSALAEHYKDNPAVAGYDILNEPTEEGGTTGMKQWIVFDKIYDAIREKDRDHVVIMESCWDAKNLPMPSEFGWENVMYSFHHYTNSGKDEKTHIASFRNKLKSIVDYGFGVPLNMGEFTCYGLENGWKETLEMLNAGGWHWTSWTYKLNRLSDSSYPGWGVYYSKASQVYPADDPYDEIISKWAGVGTFDQSNEGRCYPQTFDSGTTLEEIFTEYCN